MNERRQGSAATQCLEMRRGVYIPRALSICRLCPHLAGGGVNCGHRLSLADRMLPHRLSPGDDVLLRHQGCANFISCHTPAISPTMPRHSGSFLSQATRPVLLQCWPIPPPPKPLHPFSGPKKHNPRTCPPIPAQSTYLPASPAPTESTASCSRTSSEPQTTMSVPHSFLPSSANAKKKKTEIRQHNHHKRPKAPLRRPRRSRLRTDRASRTHQPPRRHARRVRRDRPRHLHQRRTNPRREKRILGVPVGLYRFIPRHCVTC